MPKCTDEAMELGRMGRRAIEANVDGGDIASDGGVLLLRRVDERIGPSRAAASHSSVTASRTTSSYRRLRVGASFEVASSRNDRMAGLRW